MTNFLSSLSNNLHLRPDCDPSEKLIPKAGATSVCDIYFLLIKTHLTINTFDNKMCKLHKNVNFIFLTDVQLIQILILLRWLKNLILLSK